MAEGAPLLRVYGLTPIEGSNPSLSAIQFDRAPGLRNAECLLMARKIRTFDSKRPGSTAERGCAKQRRPQGANPSLSAMLH